jgi:hypothetical protein
MTVKQDPDFGYGTETYSGGDGFMAWMAQGEWLPQDNRGGISYFPYENGAPAQYEADGINDFLQQHGYISNDYYFVTLTTSQSEMQSDAEFDIGHDGHPMIFRANAEHLTNWEGKINTVINHVIKGYAYDSSTLTYADSASTSDQGSAGDYSQSWALMWLAEDTTTGGATGLIIN